MSSEIPMAVVAECTVPECVYNRASRCHARAITIGNGDHPQCDTFHCAHNHPQDDAPPTGVGACKLVSCHFNHHYNCEAERVYVGATPGGPGCLSYRR